MNVYLTENSSIIIETISIVTNPIENTNQIFICQENGPDIGFGLCPGDEVLLNTKSIIKTSVACHIEIENDINGLLL